MTAKERKLWNKAYSTAHVAADLTEKAIAKGKCDPDWLLEEARELNCIAQSLSNMYHGQRPETVSP